MCIYSLKKKVGDGTAAIQALDDNNYMDGGLRTTWDAVNRVLDEFYNLNSQCGSGTDPAEFFSCNRNDVLILFTDGEPTDQSVCPDMKPRVQFENDDGRSMDFVVVFINPGGVNNVSSVSCLDYLDGGVDVVEITEFTNSALNEIEGVIRAATCNDENPQTEGLPPEDRWTYDGGSNTLPPVPTLVNQANVGFELQDENDYESKSKVSTQAMIISIIGAIVLILIIAGSIYYCKYKQSKTVSMRNINHMHQISIDDLEIDENNDIDINNDGPIPSNDTFVE